MRHFMTLLSSFRQIPGQYTVAGRDHFLSSLFQFTFLMILISFDAK